MQVRVRFFASLREAFGPGELLELPPGATVAQARAQLVARGGDWARLLGPGRAVRAALAQAMCGDDAVIGEGAELAFFPPVTGG